jgi:L-seryl-tRNA(Ser) seleniumtransferase
MPRTAPHPERPRGSKAPDSLSSLPSVDRVLRQPETAALIEAHGRAAVTEEIRGALAKARSVRTVSSMGMIVDAVAARFATLAAPSPRPVFNLTGTILHTNLGRAVLPQEAIAAMAQAAGEPTDLEYDLDSGKRGDRDSHVEALLTQLTGAAAATVVNNNAAAVLLVLNTLAQRREVPVSRGELIEIGGAFRMPEIMKRAGCKLVEVGTTNRTHLADYEAAISPRTALLMKVHPSNYEIRGFTSAVAERDLAALARRHSVPLVSDLGAGALVDLRRWGLTHEPTAAETIAAGVDVVTFSGDKLLGGPQAGLIVGRADLIAKIKRNPLKRALRLDKVTLAALAAVLRLYADPDRLAERLPTLRHLTRKAADIEAQARRLLPAFGQALSGRAQVSVVACESQVGSGSLPSSRLPSFALVVAPRASVEALARAFRVLPKPVIGRIHDGALYFDLRCLEDERQLVEQLARLTLAAPPLTPPLSPRNVGRGGRTRS